MTSVENAAPDGRVYFLFQESDRVSFEENWRAGFRWVGNVVIAASIYHLDRYGDKFMNSQVKVHRDLVGSDNVMFGPWRATGRWERLELEYNLQVYRAGLFVRGLAPEQLPSNTDRLPVIFIND